MTAPGSSPAWDLRSGGAIYVEKVGELLEPRRVVSVRATLGGNILIEYEVGSEVRTWLVSRNRRVRVASGWRAEPHGLSMAARVALRGGPFGAVIAVLAILGAVLHVPSGGGIALLIVVLWLAGCVAMVTTPEDRR